MMRLIKLFIGLLIVVGIGFCLYAYKYHSLAMQGWKLFNDRCQKVNPHLIKVRNTHLGIGAALSGEASPSSQQLEADLASLPDSLTAYLKAEKDWLNKQGTLINRWDFNLLEPEYMKIAGKYQLALYQAYYDYYNVFYNTLYNKDKTYIGIHSQESSDLLDKYLADREKYQKLYNEAFDRGSVIRDWRKTFAQVPEPDCQIENLIIPKYYSPSVTPVPSTEDKKLDIKS